MINVEWLKAQIPLPTVKGIAACLATLIREGKIAVGTKLPPVRSIAEALEVSPATVSAAWALLKKQKVITGTGRTGVLVCGSNATARPIRYETIGNYGPHIKADLLLAGPDPALLPDLQKALLMGLHSSHLNSYVREPISGVLVDAIKNKWPFKADSFTATNGGFDALNLIIQTLVNSGDKVIIEDPSAARILDMLDNVGAEMLPVACDNEGPLPEELSLQLQKKPVMFIYQPRTHSATGTSVSEERRNELSRRVKEHNDLIILEDDGIGELSAHPVWSLGEHYPERTLYVRSYSKAYGPDLRLAVISGPYNLLKRLQSFKQFGASWTSRILQEAVAWMVCEPVIQEQLSATKTVYAARREKLRLALAQRGLTLPVRDGLSIYIPVVSEQFALVTLAARGIAVLPGSRLSSLGEQYIRVATSCLQDSQIEFVADAIILACGPIQN